MDGDFYGNGMDRVGMDKMRRQMTGSLNDRINKKREPKSINQSDWMFTFFSFFTGTTKVSTTWWLGMKTVCFASCGSQLLYYSHVLRVYPVTGNVEPRRLTMTHLKCGE